MSDFGCRSNRLSLQTLTDIQNLASDIRSLPHQLLVRATDEPVGHSGDVIANHAMNRLAGGLLQVVIRHAVGLLDKKSEQLRDHGGGASALARQRFGRIDGAVQETLESAIRG